MSQPQFEDRFKTQLAWCCGVAVAALLFLLVVATIAATLDPNG